MRLVCDVLCALTLVAGMYYALAARATATLAGIEEERIHSRRVGLRRIGGVAMLLLSVSLYAGFNLIDPRGSAAAFLLVWAAVLFLLVSVMVLALVDLRLTSRLRRQHQQPGSNA